MTSDRKNVEAALVAGSVVGIPTDTVYGLAAVATNDIALDRIFELKERPPGLALPVLVSDLEQAERFLGRSDERLARLARHFWPGALTVVARFELVDAPTLGGDGSSVGLRCPDDDVVRDLCRAIGPLAVTSANRHGGAPITSASQFTEIFGDAIGVVLDGGVRDGVPSTVVSIADERSRALRVGTIPWSEILAVLETSSMG
ncbi:MAG: L-threonylcarbamoyladenylate synthase [Acidimicrobiales bacterium]